MIPPTCPPPHFLLNAKEYQSLESLMEFLSWHFFFYSELNIVRFYTLESRVCCIAQLCTGVSVV